MEQTRKRFMNEVFEDHSVEEVPVEDRRGFLSVSATTAAWIITMSTCYTGSVLAMGLNFADALYAAILGMTVLASFGFLQAWTGARSGLGTTLIANKVFGVIGGRVFALLMSFVLGVGWFAWQLSFFGHTVSAYWDQSFWGRPEIAMIWGGILIITSTFIGYRALEALSLFAVPLIIILSLWGLHLAIEEAAGWQGLFISERQGEAMSFIDAVGIVVGNGVIGAVMFADLTRYSRTPLLGGIAASMGYFIGGVFLILAGAVVTYVVAVPGGDLPLAMRELGFGMFGFLILLFAQWTTNNNNLYSGSLAFTSVIGHGKCIVVPVMGGVGLLIALSGVQDYFVPLLLILGAFVPPVAGVMIADIWGVRKFVLSKGLVSETQRNASAVGSAIIGGIAAYNWDFGLASVTGLLTAFFLHYLISTFLMAISVFAEKSCVNR